MDRDINCWTQTKPTEAGHYWYRESLREDPTVILYDSQLCWFIDGDQGCPLEKMDGYFSRLKIEEPVMTFGQVQLLI